VTRCDEVGLTVVVWNVRVDVVTNQQLNDVIAVHLGGVAKCGASSVVTGVDVGTSGQQQPDRQQTCLFFLRKHHRRNRYVLVSAIPPKTPFAAR